MVKMPKMCPQTKHINTKYHHFRDHVRTKRIFVTACATEDMIADYLTKPLPRDIFEKHRFNLQGW